MRDTEIIFVVLISRFRENLLFKNQSKSSSINGKRFKKNEKKMLKTKKLYIDSSHFENGILR